MSQSKTVLLDLNFVNLECWKNGRGEEFENC